MKTSVIKTLFMIAFLAATCHRMQDIGGVDSGPDADSDVDSDTDSTADFELFGHVKLAQRTTVVDQGGSLTLSAAFFDFAYDPDADSWVETRTTPDGVECDIYYVSGLPPDPLDPPPDQVNGGAIKVGSEGIWPDLLYVEFDGEAYTADHRTQWDADNPMPGWLVPGSFQVTFDGEGHGAVAAFDELVEVSPIPEVSPDSPGGVDEEGNYLWEWESSGADEVVFALHFNMDWDDSSFVCPVAPGVEQIKIPEEWISEFSWGGGELALFSRDQLEVAAGGGLVLLDVTRAHTVPFVSSSD